MIDFISGAIIFDDGISISKHTKINDIERLFGAREVLSTNERRQFSLDVHLSGGVSWGVGAIFTNAILYQVWLQCLSCMDDAHTSWTLDNEMIRKKFHDEFIDKLRHKNCHVQQSGASMEACFSWGKIASVMDVRGVQALLVISYDK
jgi:hypothetical protein